jgi:hypothetical protein
LVAAGALLNLTPDDAFTHSRTRIPGESPTDDESPALSDPDPDVYQKVVTSL